MSNITYTNKAVGGAGDIGKWTAANANEVKAAVNSKADALAAFTALVGTDWTGVSKYRELTGNLALTLTTTLKTGMLLVKQDGTGGRTMSINGTALDINTAIDSWTAITFVYNDASSEYILSVDKSVVLLGSGGGGGGSYDADSEAFFDYIETTLGASLTTAEKDAVDGLVVARKAAGLWAKDIAIYPRVGSTVAAMGVNLKNPALYPNAYTGAPSVHADGLSWTGGTDRAALTGLDRDAIGSNHFGFDVWVQSNVQNVYFGMESGLQIAVFLTDNANLFSYVGIGSSSAGIAIPNLNNAGLLNTLQRLDATTAEYYRGAVLIGQDGTATNSFGDTTQDLTIHGYNGNFNADSVVESYSGVHLAFSGAEQADNNTSVSAFITALGR